MDNFLVVDILDSRSDLMQIVFCLDLGYPPTPFNQFIESLIGAEFEDYVDIELIFEVVLEFDNILGLHSTMNFNL